MKKIILGIFILFAFVFRPAQDAMTQRTQQQPVPKDIQNTALKQSIDAKQDTVLNNLKQIAKKATKAKIVYLYRYRTIRDTIFVPYDSLNDYETGSDTCDCIIPKDTVIMKISRKNLLQRLAGNTRSDTSYFKLHKTKQL